MVNKKNIEYNLTPLTKTLSVIKQHVMTNCENSQIKSMSQRLKLRAVHGETMQEFLPEAFALVFEAVRRTLGITPYDSQLLAALAMTEGQIIELATGEGKTLAAVFTAYFMSLSGKGVHVLTANDYLAQRDALWMKPVYDLLDVSVSYLSEHTDRDNRKQAYNADITYVTAKEAGFDYLRGFLGYEADALVQRPFHFAVIDEADSILIDEARVPLVIAGDSDTSLLIEQRIFETVGSMQKGIHFNTDDYDTIIYLEECGVAFLEQQLQINNLYDDKSIGIMETAEAILQALFLLKRDVDYIVKEDQVHIIDQFTGRIAQNRQWSDVLQAAVERKERVTPEQKGKIMTSVTLQNFLSLYPNFCGMTGTACAAASEILKFYHTNVTVIPSNKPCIRIDLPDLIFATKAAKRSAIAAEVKKVHATGRPILIGTCSVEESEQLAALLGDSVPQLEVLNAKNDAQEAQIIANAGMLGAVTISTNMAGRGVDIRLGGEHGLNYDQICALGGLYVIGTNRHESIRIDNQLRGRAGRQGDPGTSRFFISLEDDLIVRYGLNDAIPATYKSKNDLAPLKNKEVSNAIKRIQKIIEVQIFDAKTTLAKYSRIIEDQRLSVHKKREGILRGEISLSILEQKNPEQYHKLLTQVSEDEFMRAQKQIELFAINKCWSDYLLFVDSLMDEITIISEARADPLEYYNRNVIRGFACFEQQIYAVVLGIYDSVIVKDRHIALDEMDIKGPTATKTYLVHDGTELQNFMDGAAAIGAAAFAMPLFLLGLIFEKRKRDKNNH